jgi:hypothetical protein
VDRSRSAQEGLPASIEAACSLAVQLQPNRDRLTLYRVERGADPFYDDPPFASREPLQALFIKELSVPPRLNRTFPEAFLRQAADDARNWRGPVLIAFFWDGGNDDGSAHGLSAYRAAIRRLAANPRVRGVGIFGVRRQNWAGVKRGFAPLGERLEIHPLEEMSPASLLARAE